MPAITSANLANAIVKLVAADALPALVGNLVMGNLVNRDYEPVLAQAGDTVNIPIAPSLVANNLVEGNTVQLQNPNVGNAQIVLNTHAESTFQIPDITKVLAVPDLLKLYMEPAVAAIAQRNCVSPRARLAACARVASVPRADRIAALPGRPIRRRSIDRLFAGHRRSWRGLDSIADRRRGRDCVWRSRRR